MAFCVDFRKNVISICQFYSHRRRITALWNFGVAEVIGDFGNIVRPHALSWDSTVTKLSFNHDAGGFAPSMYSDCCHRV